MIVSDAKAGEEASRQASRRNGFIVGGSELRPGSTEEVGGEEALEVVRRKVRREGAAGRCRGAEETEAQAADRGLGDGA